MIKMLTSFTREVDDAEKAVSEITAQLAPRLNLLKSSVGIMYYYPDFFEAGTARAIYEAMPFPIVGCTTPNASVNGAADAVILVLSVLTSDDALFSCGVTAGLNECENDAIGCLYSSMTSSLGGNPVMLFSLFPIIDTISSDSYIDTIDKFSNGLPLFGSIAFAPQNNYSLARVFCDGEQYADELAMIAIGGEVAPRFCLTRMSDENMLTASAVITESQGNVIRGINGITAVSYLESVGLAMEGELDGITAMPMSILMDDGSRIIRMPYKVTDEGAVICFTSVPQGAKINFCRGDADYVIQSAEKIMSEIASMEPNAVMIFSCVARKWALGARMNAEPHTLLRTLSGSVPFNMACSGGEICPIPRGDGVQVNKIHHFSLVACLL
jgi:hypothetical protein